MCVRVLIYTLRAMVDTWLHFFNYCLNPYTQGVAGQFNQRFKRKDFHDEKRDLASS